MYLEELKSEDTAFIDTNIFLYNSFQTPKYLKSSQGFLSRVESEEVKGFTSVLVLNEVWYKLLIAKVMEEHGLERKEVRTFIKNNPDTLKIEEPRKTVNKLEELVTVLPTPSEAISLAKKYSTEHLLLTSDAIILATMKQNNLTNLASNDSDFERVDWVELYKPSPKEPPQEPSQESSPER